MKYPKPIMTINELVELGYGRSYLNDLCHDPEQRFATRSRNGGRWYIDTEKLDAYLEKKASREAMRRRGDTRTCRQLMREAM